MALDLCRNFVSAQYLENYLNFFSPNFIYAFILTRSSLGLSHIIICIFVPEFWPFIYAKISFSFNYWRTNTHNFTKFYICIPIDKIYLGLLHIIFCAFVPVLYPLIYSKIWFPLNILRTNGKILIKLYITIYTNKIYFGIVSCYFSHICTSVVTLDLRQNFYSFQNPENK